jgi:uncharacterized repeat protein (TIGR01451 family)
MFPQIVSNLSLTPQASTQLVYYLRRLQKERITRRLQAVAGILLVGLQLAIVWTPTVNINASSDNDIVFSGLGSQNPRDALLQVYDQDRDTAGHSGFQALFRHFGITRQDLADTTPSSISSSDRELLSLGRRNQFAEDQTVTITGGQVENSNPYSCAGSHPQLSRNSTGDCVKHLQWYLNHKFGYTLAEDGNFGPLTEEAVRDLQRRAAITDDGIVGQLTWGKLHDLLATKARSNVQTYYLRPLYLWDKDGQEQTYPALAGHKSDGSKFWIMTDCGNLVVKAQSTTPTTPTPVTPTPVTTTTPTPVTPKSPRIELSKSAVYVNTGGQAVNADGTTAKAGDSILYSLTTSNRGTATQTDYVVAEDAGDILEYATITDLRGAKLSGKILSWPKQDIAPGSAVVKTFIVKIKDPIPSTPVSASDPLSYDLRLDNVYGQIVKINVTPTPVKQVEATATALPQTGNTTSLLIVSFFTALSLYFYLRNRQLIKEVRILRVDHNPGV